MADLVDVYRQKAPSTLLKRLLTVLHLGAVLAVAWLLFGGGIHVVSGQLQLTPATGPTLRRVLLLSASVVYFLRIAITTLVFLKRRMGWGEVGVVAAGIGGLHLCFAFLGGRQVAPIGVVEGLGALLYIGGSWINSGAELQRHLWKRQHEGRLYTEGLFRYAMHINYFGDVVLFTGWALLTHYWLLLAVPALMLCGFIFLHVPTLDRYLAERHGQAFQMYRSRTKKLIPFLY